MKYADFSEIHGFPVDSRLKSSEKHTFLPDRMREQTEKHLQISTKSTVFSELSRGKHLTKNHLHRKHLTKDHLPRKVTPIFYHFAHVNIVLAS